MSDLQSDDDDPQVDSKGVEAQQYGAPGANDDVVWPSPRTHDKSFEAALVAPVLPINWATVVAFCQACMTSNPRVTYGLGAKVPSDTAVPGRDFTQVDCSGMVRACIRRSTSPQVKFPDGSVVQHDWVKASGLALSSIDDGKLHDGRIRIAFLPPATAPGHKIGHVVLIRDGLTVESHGGVGPDRRPWTGGDWQGYTQVYLLE